MDVVHVCYIKILIKHSIVCQRNILILQEISVLGYGKKMVSSMVLIVLYFRMVIESIIMIAFL